MKTLGNIIWIVFGGLHIALEYFIAGLILMITIIGIPFGLQSLKLGMLAICPFGTKVKWRESQPGCLSIFMNVLWFFVWRHLDMAHPHLLRSRILYHHHRHPIRKDAL